MGLAAAQQAADGLDHHGHRADPLGASTSTRNASETAENGSKRLEIEDLITIPLEFFQISEGSDFMNALGRITMGFWILDMPLNLFFGIERQGKQEMRVSELARAYFRTSNALKTSRKKHRKSAKIPKFALKIIEQRRKSGRKA